MTTPTWDALPDDEATPGLAGERTDLAWSRSGLAALACAASVLKRVLDEVDDVRAPTLVFGLLLAGGVAWMFALAHARAVARTTLAGRRLADPDRLRAVAIGTSAVALGAAALALVPAA